MSTLLPPPPEPVSTPKKDVCPKCGGAGHYMYDENHGQPCELCCPHNGGWWDLSKEHHGSKYVDGGDNACCKLGCGMMRRDLPKQPVSYNTSEPITVAKALTMPLPEKLIEVLNESVRVRKKDDPEVTEYLLARQENGQLILVPPEDQGSYNCTFYTELSLMFHMRPPEAGIEGLDESFGPLKTVDGKVTFILPLFLLPVTIDVVEEKADLLNNKKEEILYVRKDWTASNENFRKTMESYRDFLDMAARGDVIQRFDGFPYMPIMAGRAGEVILRGNKVVAIHVSRMS